MESTHRRGLRLPQSGLRSTRGEYIEREGRSGIYALQIALASVLLCVVCFCLCLGYVDGGAGGGGQTKPPTVNGPYHTSGTDQPTREGEREGEGGTRPERERERARERARERSRDGRRFGSASTHDLPQTTGPPTSPSQRSEAKRCKELPSPGSNGPRACKAAKQDEITQTRQRSVSSRWDAQVEQ